MEVQDSETYNQKIKSDRYGKIAIALFLLLALLWPLGAFMVWILLGASSYFVFLFFYYQPKRPKATSWKSSQGNSYSTNFESKDTTEQRVKLIIRIVVGVFFSLVFLGLVVNFFSNNETSEDNSTNTQTEQASSDNAKILEDDPNNVDALTNVGNEFYDQNNYDSALFYYNKVLAIDSRNSPALYNMGLVFYNQKQYQQSIDLLKTCLSIDASNKDAMYIMGHNYYDRKLYDDALSWYRQAYDAGMRDAFLSHALGYLYDNKGNNTQSIFHYKEALQQDSSRTDIYTRLAEMEPEKAAWYRAKAEQWKR